MTKHDKYVLATDDDFISLKPVPHKIYDETNEEEFFMNWDDIPSAFDIANQTRKRKDWVKEAEWVDGEPIYGDKVKQIEVLYEDGDSDVLEVNVYVSSAATRKKGLEKFAEEGSGFRMVYFDKDGDNFDEEWGNVYTGDAEYVEIPHYINGNLVTNLNMMFYMNTNIKGVINTNPHIREMEETFFELQTPKLELLIFDTSNVERVGMTFEMAEIGILEVHDLDFPNLEWGKEDLFSGARIGEAYAHTQEVADNLNNNYQVPPWYGLKPTEFKVPEGFTPIVTEGEIKDIPVPYRTVYSNDYTKEYGEETVVKEGVDGTATREVKSIKSTDGTEHEAVIAEDITKEPINKEISVGTGPEVDMGYALAKDEDFEDGRYGLSYIGSKEYVKLPYVINGELVTTHESMFRGNETIKGVMSKSPYVTDMQRMFYGVSTTELELDDFNTSAVTNMREMFREISSLIELDLSGFDTSNVTNMNDMFRSTRAELKINSFNTQKVTDMYQMFIYLKMKELDISSFDVTGNPNTKNMFGDSEIETVYVRSEEDKEVFESIAYTPNTLNFVVGGAGYIPPVRLVSTTEESVEIEVPFPVEEIEDEYLAEGLTEVFQEGENGSSIEVYKVYEYSDGSTKRELIDTETITEPTPQIVYIGTAKYESLEEIEREEIIPHYTEYIDDDTMYVHEEEVRQEGEDGLMRLTIRVTTFFDGDVQEEILEEEILKEAIPKLIHRGTKLEEDTRIEYEYIDYETEYIESDKLTKGREQVIQSGKRGQIRYVYAIKVLDSGEIEEELVEEYRTEPINRIIYIGTREAKHWVTEVYLLSEQRDRDYFVDKSRETPVGLSEEFGITLSERPTIPTAQMRTDSQVIAGRLGSLAAEDNYDNVEISLHFNYIDEGNARETYNKVSNALSKMEAGITRLRFSDDKDGSFRVLAERPSIEELNNDLLNWGDFVVRLTLKPFRYIEQKEVELTPNVDYNLKQPLKNAQRTAQRVQHQTEHSIDIGMTKNNERIYTVADATTEVVIVDATLLSTYGGDIK